MIDRAFGDREIAVLYIDNNAPVSLQTVGVFLQQLGRSTALVGEDNKIAIELVAFEQGSLKWFLGWTDDDSREPSKWPRPKRMELYTIIGLALATPPSALALRELLKEAKADEVALSATGKPIKRIKLPDLDNAVHRVRSKTLTLEEKHDMLSEYDDGDQIETAGRIMPRKRSVFQTASGTKLPILGATEGMRPGQLVGIQAEVQKAGREIGILIHQFRDLDDP